MWKSKSKDFHIKRLNMLKSYADICKIPYMYVFINRFRYKINALFHIHIKHIKVWLNNECSETNGIHDKVLMRNWMTNEELNGRIDAFVDK